LAPPPFRAVRVDGDHVMIASHTAVPPLFALGGSSTTNGGRRG
jgi:hypothetical protein